jgi:hypothetical protein
MLLTANVKRLLAALAGLWLVASGVLGARHEAQVAHAFDRYGVAFHAAGLVGDHTSRDSDIHAAGARDHDACGIATTLHQATRPSPAHVRVAPVPAIEFVSRTDARAAATARVVYRLAPKTSPPASV